MILPASPNIAGRQVGPGHPPFVIAELSANHNGSLERALAIVDAAAAAGADAVKIQTYSADALTLPLEHPPFRIERGPWAGQSFHTLFTKAATPPEWTPALAERARARGLLFFSTPFDEAAVDALERDLDPPAYKVASYELGHRPLLRRIARTGRPVVLSTGMGEEAEIARAVALFLEAGCPLFLLKCVSAYPAEPGQFNLHAIPTLRERFNVPVGLSDHTLDDVVALGALALGACLFEKHLCLARADGGLDSHFSLEPAELARLVASLRRLHAALGSARIGPGEAERPERAYRRSLFIARPVEAGETLSEAHVRVVRPGDGLDPWRIDEVLGATAVRDMEVGHPLSEGDFQPVSPASESPGRESAPAAPHPLPVQKRWTHPGLPGSRAATTPGS